MSIYKNRKNRLYHHQKLHQKRKKHGYRLSIDDMIGRYKSIEPLNCVEQKHKFKLGEI